VHGAPLSWCASTPAHQVLTSIGSFGSRHRLAVGIATTTTTRRVHVAAARGLLVHDTHACLAGAAAQWPPVTVRVAFVCIATIIILLRTATAAILGGRAGSSVDGGVRSPVGKGVEEVLLGAVTVWWWWLLLMWWLCVQCGSMAGAEHKQGNQRRACREQMGVWVAVLVAPEASAGSHTYTCMLEATSQGAERCAPKNSLVTGCAVGLVCLVTFFCDAVTRALMHALAMSFTATRIWPAA
jgi:hypothetical protein